MKRLMRDEGPVVGADSLDLEHLALLLRTSQILGSSLNIQDILDHLMDQVIEVIQAERGFVLLREEGQPGWTVRSAQAIDLTALDGEGFRVSRGIADRVLQNGVSVLTTDALSDERFSHRTTTRLHQYKSILCVPLTIRGQTRGAIYADHLMESGVFREREQLLLEAVARQAAIALDNAELHEKLLRVHEESLREARRELAQTQQQLIQSGKMAAVGQLAAGMAHEMNTPLAALSLNLGAVQAAISEPLLQQRLSLMEKSLCRCRDIVKRLLNFSHLGSMAEIDLAVAVADALDLISADLEQYGILVLPVVTPPLPVRGNLPQLSQVVLNLLLNAKDALRARPSAGRTIRVQACRNGSEVMLAVTDNGPGIPPEIQERMFEPFFTTKEVGQGVGLGLSISYQIALQHGGVLEAESTLGEGATFRLRLPALG